MASFTVEAVHSLYAAFTLRKTAPVCRSRITKPMTPDLPEMYFSAAANLLRSPHEKPSPRLAQLAEGLGEGDGERDGLAGAELGMADGDAAACAAGWPQPATVIRTTGTASATSARRISTP